MQGWPVIVQAGASEAGRQLAAETAEAVFTGQGNIEVGRAFYADVKGRMQKFGRDPEHMKILPGCMIYVGDSLEEAQAKRAKLDSLVHYASAIATLSIALGTDASKFDPDGPLPEIPESNASKSGRERMIELAKREGFTVRQLAQRLGGHGGLAMLGTPRMIADQMEEWLETRASDGFTLQIPYLPQGLDDVVDRRHSGVAAPRPLPPRIRGQDAARESGPAAPGQPLLRETLRVQEETMAAQIRHIAIFSDNPAQLATFYGEVFGTSVTGVDELGNAWVTDGTMDIALLNRRGRDNRKTGIHHWGFTIAPSERDGVIAKMKEHGVKIYSPYVDLPEAHRPYAEDAVKDPDGNRFDLSTGMRKVRAQPGTTTTADGARPASIRHIAIFSDDPARLAKFYVDVFGLKITGESQGDVWVTEGYVDVA